MPLKIKKQPQAGLKANIVRPLKPPASMRQVAFYRLLVFARRKWFMEALSEALGRLDPATVKSQVMEYVPTNAQKVLAAAGLRDEHIFPLPAVLQEKPSLVGYYRLLLGASQKTFYKGPTGMGPFKSMEERGVISEKQIARLSAFCSAMARPLAQLVVEIPMLTERDIRELPLLTFGAQLQGSNNTKIGKEAMRGVFASIQEIVGGHTTYTEAARLTVKNASSRVVTITLGHDPDVRIEEEVGSQTHSKVAIEIKGGTDASNVHNRAGEAEKSHLKAKRRGYRDFWTIISKQGLELSKLHLESQTTTEWFDVTEILAHKGRDWEEFRERLASAVGIPLD